MNNACGRFSFGYVKIRLIKLSLKHMLNIEIKTVAHKNQAYNTVGDHDTKGKKKIITVSDLGNWKYELLIALHELVEQSLCDARGIKDSAMHEFDKKFQKTRSKGEPSEPGDDPSAPYHQEHKVATSFERQMADALGIDWLEY